MDASNENLEQSLRTHFNIVVKINNGGFNKIQAYHKLIMLDAICQDFKLAKLSKEIRQYIENNLS